MCLGVCKVWVCLYIYVSVGFDALSVRVVTNRYVSLLIQTRVDLRGGSAVAFRDVSLLIVTCRYDSGAAAAPVCYEKVRLET